MYNTGLSFNDPFIQEILLKADALSGICFLIVASLSLFSITETAVGLLNGRGNTDYDFDPLMNYFKMIFVLLYYTDIMNMVSYLFGAVTTLVAGVLQVDLGAKPNASENLGGIDHAAMWDYFSMEGGTIVRQAFVWLSSGSINIAKIFIDRLRLLGLCITYLLGPIALMVSIVPGKKDASRVWFNAYFFLQCLAITMIILDVVYTSYNQFHIKGEESEADDIIMFIIMQCSFIAMYLLLFVWTTFYTGFSVAGAALTKVVSFTTSVASIMQRGMMNTGRVGAAAGRGVLNAPRTIVNTVQSARDMRDKIRQNHTLAKEIFRDPKGTFGMNSSSNNTSKTHQAGV